MSEFGKRLRLLREEQNLTLDEMADKLKTSKSNLSRYENDRADPALETVIRYALYFNVSLDWMAGLSDVENRGIPGRHMEQSGKLIAYSSALRKLEESKIPPEKLEQIIDVLKE